MTAPSSGAQVRAPLLIYMVAGSYWCPSLHAGGLRVDPRAQEPGIAVRMTDAFKANAIPLFPGESPMISDVKDWWEDARSLIPADQLATFSSTTPRGALDFTPNTVPEALVVSAANPGTTESMKQQRLALILTINDANTLKETKRAAYMSELGQSLFDTLDRAVRPSAPLLWAKLKRTCKQAEPFEQYYDGGKALRTLVAMSDAKAMKPGEESIHESHLLMLTLRPLPKGATAEQFSLRVTNALENHIPYLMRPMTDAQIADWVVKQAPHDWHGHRLR